MLVLDVFNSKFIKGPQDASAWRTAGRKQLLTAHFHQAGWGKPIMRHIPELARNPVHFAGQVKANSIELQFRATLTRGGWK